MSNITFQNTKVNDGRANDTGVNSGTAVTLHNVKFTYTWKNLINADPVPQKQLSSTRKFGIAEVDVAGFENPRIIIEGVINVDNIEANEITVPLIQDFCKIKFDGTITTAIKVIIKSGAGDTHVSLPDYKGGTSQIYCLVESFTVDPDQGSQMLHIWRYTINLVETQVLGD